MSSLDYLDLCRLCLVKDGVSVPIFEGEGDVRQIFLKIAACLPVKVAREDKLPKKICDNCVYKVELLYQFWNTTANAEKQLLQWLGEVGLEDKQGYVTGVLNTSTMKEEDDASSVIQSSIATTTPQSGIGIGVIDNIGLGMPFSGTTHQQQLPPTIPINQPIHQALPGPSNQPAPDQLSQTQGNATTRPQDEEEESSEEEDNSDDDCDADDGLPVKEESEEDLGNSRNIEPTTFVNVSLACDEAGPSGLQQQKNTTEIPELSMPQTLNESDAKSGQCSIEHDQFQGELNVIQTDLNLTPVESKSEGNVKTCEICQEQFHFVTRLVAHLRIAHGIQRPFKCNSCWRTYAQQFMLNAHVKKSHTPKNVSCHQCKFVCVTKADLERHKKKQHELTLKYYCECNGCGVTFGDASTLKQHRTSCDHFVPLTPGIKKIPDAEHRCDLCGKCYEFKSILKQHKIEIHGIHTYERPRRRYLCALCGKELKTAKGFEIHNRSHTGEKPYTCEVCGKCFACETLLRTHNVTHTGERKYTCDQCGKSFTQRSTLVVHKRYHTGERPYVCPKCGKGFVTRTILNTHLKSCR
ncbi:zinc finger protein 768-like isoform X16 [Athalia rosae]|uniref:zinc finger protein 768-like isoform X16 n=1 Tax=Athalia rosae TaxID=37344 RepID=UPI002033EB1D|nr:zinc finger protein 768-like isoform X16 [Athalia rosae]